MQQRQVTMGEAFSKFWKTWSAEGRASRSEFWWVFLANFLIGFALGIVGGIIGADTALSGLYSLAACVPGILLAIRRLHDTGKSGWLWLVAFVPVVGTLILLVLLAQPSEPQQNRFGPVPNVQ